MKKWIYVTAVCLTAGCVQNPDDDAMQQATEPEALAYTSYEEVPDRDDDAMCRSGDLEALYEVTDRSVHELVTCAGLQIQLAQSMVGLLLLSNDRMFDETTRTDLAAFADILPKNRFAPQTDGRWRIDMGAESYFDLEFTDPATGERLQEDPFDMESYLVGLQATYELTFDQMMEAPEERNRWVFTWDEPGPLIHLLNSGQKVPREFVLELSLYEIIALVFPGYGSTEEPDAGPFTSLFDMPMSSEIHLREERSVRAGVAEVTYEVHTPSQPVGLTASRAGLDFEIVTLSSRLRGRTLRATEATVGFDGHVGALTGAIEMQSDDDVVILDFGDGASYPEAVWSCDLR